MIIIAEDVYIQYLEVQYIITLFIHKKLFLYPKKRMIFVGWFNSKIFIGLFCLFYNVINITDISIIYLFTSV